MADSLTEELANYRGKTKDEVMEDLVKAVPLGRLTDPDDVANLVSFLASKDSDFMTGQSILVNGGTHFS